MTDFLHGVEVVEIQEGIRPIRTVRSAVIGLVGSAPIGPVNKPTLVAGSRTEAVRKFGAGVGTIPDALEAIFKQAGAAVVVVNVLDPATDKKAVAAKDYALAGDVARLDDRYASAVVVKSAVPVPGAPYILNTDYTVDEAAGTVSRVGTGDIAAADSTIYVTYEDANGNPITVGDVALVGGAVDLQARNISNVVVRRATAAVTYVEDTDYAVNGAAGTVTRIEGGAIAAGADLSIGYDVPDETRITAADIEGGVDAGTGAYTGISALLGAASALGHTPRILIAPGYSSTKSVADALISVAGRLRATAPIEGPSTTDEAAQTYRNDFGSRRAFLVDPDVQIAGDDGKPVSAPNSAYVAGVIAKSDAERGFWWSPSNREILGMVGTERPIDFALGDKNARANLLNENEVATIIRERGFRLWGNRTCSADPKWAFLSVVRTADILNDSLLRAHLWAVDRNISRTYFDDVSEGVNAYIRELVGLGALLGGQCYPTPELNTKESVAAGRVYFDIEFTPPPPAERVTFRSRLTNDYLETLFDVEEGGEEEAEEEAA